MNEGLESGGWVQGSLEKDLLQGREPNPAAFVCVLALVFFHSQCKTVTKSK